MQIRLPFEELLKRLVLLGLPLLPIGCTAGQNPDRPVRCPHIFDDDLSIQMPAIDPDGGIGVTIADWQACLNTANCTALCQEVTANSLGFPPKQVTACERKAGGGDAGQAPDAAGSPAVTIHLAYSYNDCTGRRPEGLVPCGLAAGDADTGRWLAQVAALEAASVPAFRRLARELDAHGAPGHLVRAARAAEIDETRHHALMAALARSHGVVVRVPAVQRLPVRSLVAVAVENAREGCVRETFGALTAAYQVRHARDPLLRAAMNTIARDEARHARLSWQVDAWARTVVPRAAIAVLDETKAAAAMEMAAELAAAPPPDQLAAAVGLPSAAVAGDLMERGQRWLWAA